MRVLRPLALLVLGITLGHAQPAAAWFPTQADLAITKVAHQDHVAQGGNLSYTIELKNAGPDAATGVTLSDPIPANTTFVSFTQNSGPTFTCTTPAVGGTGVVTCAAAVFAAGACASFTLVVNVNPNTAVGSIITNTAVVLAATPDLNTGNNRATATATVCAIAADLAVSKTDSPDPVTAGSDLSYSIAVVNNGPDAATSVRLDDQIPANTTFVSFTQNSGPAFTLTNPPAGGTGTATATIGSFAAGASASFTLVVNVNANTAVGTVITNTATIRSSTSDPMHGNNSATAKTTVRAIAADLAVSKTDSPDPVTAGNNLSYAIAVVNNGPADAQSVTLSDQIPANTTFVSFTQNTGPAFTLTTPAVGGTGTVTATIGTLAAGATATFTLVVNVNANTPQGSTIANTATVSSNTNDSTPGNNSAPTTTAVVASADLGVGKSDSPDPVEAGSDLTYLLQLTSAGPSDAQNVSLTDQIPANTTFVSFTQNTGPAFTLTTPAAGASGTVTATIGTFAAGATATFTLVVNVNADTSDGTVITNTANVSSTTSDPASGNNSAPTTTEVNAPASADLAVTKLDSPDPVEAGSDLTYSITLVNNGPADAQSVTLTDQVPANTTFVSFTQDSGPTFTLTAPPVDGTGPVTASIATLASGATATFTLVVNVVPTAFGTVITNTATVSSSTNDPDPSDDSATTTTDVIEPPPPEG